MDGVLSIPAQCSVTDDEPDKRVMFVDHKPGKVPMLEAISVARAVAKKSKKAPGVARSR